MEYTPEDTEPPGDSALGLPHRFWRRVQTANNRLLMIDYDGTLAPFRVERMQAQPSGETRDVLNALVESAHTHVVIVSGRAANEVRELLAGLPVETFGAHGFERSPDPDTIVRDELSPREEAGLKAAREAAEAAGLSQRIEIKPASIAVHVRGMPPKEALETEELAFNVLTPIAESYPLECRAFHGGVEIRSKRFHKGNAVKALLAEWPGDVLPVYVGDDDTDEDAFRVLSGKGVGIRVGAHPSETAANLQLHSQSDVLPFLRRWSEIAQQTKRAFVAAETPGRLVVVSNRLPTVETDAEGARARPVGGLASALEAALSQSEGGGLWLGWSGRTTTAPGVDSVESTLAEAVHMMGLDLTVREHEAYYNGFSNRTVWPLFHSFPNLADFSSWELEVYRSVNAKFAQTLGSELRKNDLVWVHDYHLMLLAHELRRVGWRGRLGFFLHIPFPALDILGIIPDCHGFMKALRGYELIGFQTQSYLDNYVYACQQMFDDEFDGTHIRGTLPDQRVGVYPIGIDVEKFVPTATTAKGGRALGDTLGDVDVVIGVDRVDYTKGLPQRLLAFEALFKLKPQLKRRVSLVQISSPSRTDVSQYKEQKRKLDSLVGRINSGLGEHDWVPIRYLYRSYPQSELARFYRQARVGLVTPLRDGMNLVAKEYVAAQEPTDPGVLVLSQFAGAAHELDAAVIVNPYLPESTAHGIAQALEMPVEERRERHAAMLETIKRQNVHKWARDFVADLSEA